MERTGLMSKGDRMDNTLVRDDKKENPRQKLPILCLDFDGVIHRYSEGWKGENNIYDPPTSGFFDWLMGAIPKFRIAIYSSRSRTQEGIERMVIWIGMYWASWLQESDDNIEKAEHALPVGMDLLDVIEFHSQKPPAFLTIDDRCVRFEGDWNDLPIDELRNFKPWMSK